MAQKEKNRSVTDFLVIFFIGNHMISQMLSKVVENRTNTLYHEALGLPEGFVLPFFQEETQSVSSYVLRQEGSSLFRAELDHQVCQERILQNGDYITFKDPTGAAKVKVLLIARSSLSLSYKKYCLPKNSNVYIGRGAQNDIVFTLSNYISREKQVAIRVDDQGCVYVEDLKRTVGIYVNGQAVHSRKLEPFDELAFMGFSLIYLGENIIAIRDLCIETSLSEVHDWPLKAPKQQASKETYFISTPRISRTLEPEEIEVDGPPSPPSMDKTPLILSIGPSLTMSMVMLVSVGVSVANALNGGSTASVVTSGVMAVGMLLGSLLWPTLLRNYQKKRLAAETAYREARYTAYIQEIDQILAEKESHAVKLLDQTLNPPPETLCAMLDNEVNRLRLWERSVQDEDFLRVRLGIGSRPSKLKIKIPKVGFQLHPDKLSMLPGQLVQKYSVLSDVPMTLDLGSSQTIGLIGDQENLYTLLESIILNIIALHPYNEAKLVFVVPPQQAHRFEMFKDVPHVWSDDKKIRYFATTSDEVHFIFSAIDEEIQTRKNQESKGKAPVPHYVVLVMHPSLIEREALLRYMNDPQNDVGITTLFAYGDITELPRSCKTIIQSDTSRTGFYIRNENKNRFIPFTLDSLQVNRIQDFAGRLSQLPIRYDTRSLGIVDRISFLQMYKAGNVKDLDVETYWDNNNSAKSLAAPIGVMAGGEVFSLDIHQDYHGCHGLVAGTSGSGKSEFLQAFVLSLAIHFSPKEVAFVLVDFKGGDMARPFMAKKNSPGLPHLAATISDLSGSILYRALVSLQAEINARKICFNQAASTLGVDKIDINSYHKYYKAGRLSKPLPHLVIIVDEFAQLKTQQPEFLTQLINVAQVGRSLGIHLILATQKPAGIVDPQIMSNSHFKICLRVADKQDSTDVLNKPDAAMIKNPGRMYLQVGYDEIYECIQSAYSGAEYAPTRTYMPDDEITVQMTDHTANPVDTAKLDVAEKTDKTQLEAVVAELTALGHKKGLSVKPLWLDVLPEKILLSSISAGRRGLATATLGMVDYVYAQEQRPLTVDFARMGHIALYGASGTGKTTFLQTLVFSMVVQYGYTPQELNFYVMDFGGRSLGYLDLLPHTGGVVFADEAEKVAGLYTLLSSILDERKQLFAANHCGSFADYRSLGKEPLPAIVVLLDHYAAFREKYMDLSEQFAQLIGAGSTLGVYFVITGTAKNSIHYKTAESISTQFVLHMNDPNAYLDILNLRPAFIPVHVPGRGLMADGKEAVEFQLALGVDGENETARTSAICEQYKKIAAEWHGFLPLQLNDGQSSSQPASFSPAEDSFAAPSVPRPAPCEDSPENLILATSLSGAMLYGISLAETSNVCIYAADQSHLAGRLQETLRTIFLQPDRTVVLIDNRSGLLASAAQAFPACRYIQTLEELDGWIEDLKPELNRRLEEETSRRHHLFVLIAEFHAFFEEITDQQAAFLRKVFRYIDGPQYGISFICGCDVNGGTNLDSLFLHLVSSAGSALIAPGCYEAAAGISTLPFLQKARKDTGYFVTDGKAVEIGW